MYQLSGKRDLVESPALDPGIDFQRLTVGDARGSVDHPRPDAQSSGEGDWPQSLYESSLRSLALGRSPSEGRSLRTPVAFIWVCCNSIRLMLKGAAATHARRLQDGLERLDVREHLSLVVARTQAAIAPSRLARL